MGLVCNESHFWKTFFEEDQLISKLPDIAARKEKGQQFHVPHYGDVVVRVLAGSELGDNFMSDTFTVTAATSDETVYNGFFKVLPSNALLRSMAASMRVHNREIAMYRNFFPLLCQFRADAGLTAEQIPLNVPTVFYAREEDSEETDGSGTVMVMQDLKCDRFVMIDKINGSDYEHASLALTSLAHYHALGIAFVRKYSAPDGLTVDYPPGAEFLSERSAFDDISELVIQWLGKHIELMKKMDREDNAVWLENVLGKSPEILKPETVAECAPLACILHGDYWNNNMVFKHEGNKPVAVKMIDFQIARLSHPLNDILYFLYSSTTPETRAQYLDQLLREYFALLTTTLLLLGIDLENEGYGIDRFFNDYKKRSVWGLMMGLVVAPLALNEKVVGDLHVLDEEMKTNNSAERVTETREEKKRSSALDPEAEEKMKSLINVDQLLDNPLLCRRIVQLVDEVKELNCM